MPDRRSLTMADDTLFVAVHREARESSSVLYWALNNRGNHKICLLHVHRLHNSGEGEAERAGKRLSKKMKVYLDLCKKENVEAEIHCMIQQHDHSVQDGIVELLYSKGVSKLVMGAAADHKYHEKMIDISSRKAMYVRVNAPSYCHIWFLCHQSLICTRNPFIQTQRAYTLALQTSYDTSVQPHQKMEALESSTELDENLRKEQDQVKTQSDNALNQGGSSSHDIFMVCLEFSPTEIEKATNNFDPSLKIQEDANRIVYKGFLCLTEILVEIPHPDCIFDLQLFQQKVEILSKVRHPNVVNLMGACHKYKALIYEYYPNEATTLEDKLILENEASKLTWQVRVRIASQICSILAFLHSRHPSPIVHGDLRPKNIYIDPRYTCKLKNFKASSGVPKLLFDDYKDLDYFSTGEYTTKSDVYSFGIILMRLLTRKSAFGLARGVGKAMENDEVGGLLDPLAGWPLERAKMLAALGLLCCESTYEGRLDLEKDVWPILQKIMTNMECVSDV